jgi:hypothetical protein
VFISSCCLINSVLCYRFYKLYQCSCAYTLFIVFQRRTRPKLWPASNWNFYALHPECNYFSKSMHDGLLLCELLHLWTYDVLTTWIAVARAEYLVQYSIQYNYIKLLPIFMPRHCWVKSSQLEEVMCRARDFVN